METYEFTIVLDRAPTDDDLDALFEAGGDDASPEYNTEANTGVVHFDRAAPSLAEALVSAMRTLDAAGLHPVAVRSDDLVTLKEIATRIGRTYEGVRLLASGARGPGGFPVPVAAESWSLYSWTQVAAWLAEAGRLTGVTVTPSDYERIIAAADHLVRARALLGPAAGSLAELVTA